jgi:DNA-binding transcriptional ArsR family regulator
VATALKIWGNPVRLLVVKHLQAHPGQVLGQIFNAVRDDANELTGGNLLSTNLSRHLRILRDEGVVTTDLDPELIRGRSPRYWVNDDLADELLNKYVNFLNEGQR